MQHPCSVCGVGDWFHSTEVIGICIECREKQGYNVHGVCGNYAEKPGVPCIFCTKAYGPTNASTDAGREDAVIPAKTYKGACPCGIAHPATCEYHTIIKP
jgi:hypothetical protein